MTEETVKVELDIPQNVHEALTQVCNRFNYDDKEVITDSVKEILLSQCDNNFEGSFPQEQVPLYVTRKTKAYLIWWWEVANARIPTGGFSEFIMSCARKYIDPYLVSVTEEEQAKLDGALEAIGENEREQFSKLVRGLLEA